MLLRGCDGESIEDCGEDAIKKILEAMWHLLKAVEGTLDDLPADVKAAILEKLAKLLFELNVEDPFAWIEIVWSLIEEGAHAEEVWGNILKILNVYLWMDVIVDVNVDVLLTPAPTPPPPDNDDWGWGWRRLPDSKFTNPSTTQEDPCAGEGTEMSPELEKWLKIAEDLCGIISPLMA